VIKSFNSVIVVDPFLGKKLKVFKRSFVFAKLNSELFSVFSSVYRGTFQILQGLVQETDGQVGNVFPLRRTPTLSPTV
jgi:hypothetical protein